MLNCKYCNKLAKNINSLSQHQNKCSLGPNPLRPFQKMHDDIAAGKRLNWNEGHTKDTHPSVRSVSDSLKRGYQSGDIIPQGYCNWTIEQNREQAVRNQTGGYRPGSGSSKKFWMKDSYGKDVCLQSSYENRFALVLDYFEIKWIRPLPLKYGNRRYYPDFFLEEFDLYVDTKNDYLITIDTPKIEAVRKENNIRLEIVDIDQLISLEELTPLYFNGRKRGR